VAVAATATSAALTEIALANFIKPALCRFFLALIFQAPKQKILIFCLRVEASS